MSKKLSRPQLLVVVSDLHCGSSVGLMPPDSESINGNTIGFGKNLHQAWLWEKWKEAQFQALEIVGGDPFVLLCNGDATEGIHHKSPEVVATLIELHCKMAAESLRVMSEAAAQTLVVKGTECHTHEIESYLARLIGAKDGVAREKWLFRIHGTLVDATHHIGVTSRAYLEATAMSIAMGNARLNSLRAGHEPAKVFLRAHRHCGGWFSDGASMLGITGGWQFLTRHAHKVVPDAIPRPSMMVLDWRNQPEGALPNVHNLHFNPPAPDVVDL
jgi:hypothetical protein